MNQRNLGKDLSASVVVFLVALPLCLGIALASGAPLLSGVITGICGGLIAGAISGSHLAVSGPAAGLTVIVAGAIGDLGFSAFLTAVVVAGLIQVLLGIMRAGLVGSFIPDSVIKGMLAAIGIILIFKEIPHALGYDANPEGDSAFLQADGENTLSELLHLGEHIQFGALLITLVSLALLVLWEQPKIKRLVGMVPGPLVVVILGAGMNALFASVAPSWALGTEHLVNVPVFSSFGDVLSSLSRPDFSAIGQAQVWQAALIIASIASLETLLSIEATDKLDPLKRITPTNQELVAQGAGNMLAGLAGGIPMTAVIVRSTANVASGATSKASAIMHGLWLLLAIAFAPVLLNLIPLSALAAILLVVGFKLTRPSIYRSIWARGWAQFIPFIVTVGSIYFIDLLKGVIIGLVVGIVFVIISNYRVGVTMTRDRQRFLVRLNQNVSFLNKARLRAIFRSIEDGSYVIIDGTRTEFLDNDIIDTIEEFLSAAEGREITVELKKRHGVPNRYFTPEESIIDPASMASNEEPTPPGTSENAKAVA
ncbi:MAG: SulP family inorganic anion transporter [Myxococcota bacterium]